MKASKETIQNRTHTVVERLLWFVFAGTRGGANRIQIITQLLRISLNANQIAKEIGLDYKAIRHHLNVLEKNNLVIKIGEGYGATYSISPIIVAELQVIWDIVSHYNKSGRRTTIQ